MITQEYIDRSMSYDAYSKLLNDLMAQGRTTGDNQSEKYLNYAKLNLQRMGRLEKTTELTGELKEAISKLTEDCIWLVITEGWCGDAAQNLPVIHHIEKAGTRIRLALLLRDESLDVMDQYLTNGTRSIPVVICVKKQADGTYKELFVWGPRPAAAQELMMQLKRDGVEHDERSLAMQKWYNTDKTLSTQAEFAGLIRERL